MRDWQKESPWFTEGKEKRTSKTCGAVRAQRKNNLRYTQIHIGTDTHQIVVKAAALFFNIRFYFPPGKINTPLLEF